MSRFANLEQIEMTFTIEDADLDKLNNVLKDINVRECPWFEVHDKHGNKAKYYREPHWIPVTERLPEYGTEVLTINTDSDYEINHIIDEEDAEWFFDGVIAWMPLPEPYKGGQDD